MNAIVPGASFVRSAATCIAALLAWAGAVRAETHAIDPAKSNMTVRVYKTGLFSMFGHNHVISAPIAGGSVDSAAHQVEVKVNAAGLRVRDPNTPEKDRAAIQKTMLGPEVLDTEHNPEIVFKSTAVQAAGRGVWTVRGNLTLHGKSRPVTLQVRERNGHYAGSARVNQTDFGIQPVKVAGGAVRVKNEVRIDFDMQLVR